MSERPKAYRLIKYRDLENQHSHGMSEISSDLHDLTIDDLCELFERFLRASGFVFDGHVDIVEGDKEEPHE